MTTPRPNSPEPDDSGIIHSSPAPARADEGSPLPPTPEPGADADENEIEADIERTRAQLGETVEQLTNKLDVNAQAKRQVDEVKDNVAATVEDAQAQATEYAHRAKHAAEEIRHDPGRAVAAAPIVAAVLGLVVGVVVYRRTRR